MFSHPRTFTFRTTFPAFYTPADLLSVALRNLPLIFPDRRLSAPCLILLSCVHSTYLARAGYTAGPLFRASINGTGGPLSYDAAHHRWKNYCVQAGAGIGIHQLRHAHATELINAGVSIEAVRRRLGHASTETTQLYTLLDDKVADAEIRAARRRRDRAAH